MIKKKNLDTELYSLQKLTQNEPYSIFLEDNKGEKIR